MSAPADKLTDLLGGDRPAFLPYLTAGLPRPEASVDFFCALADAGADGFEVGIPYSDPLMDGPIVQRAGQAALEAGTTFDLALDITEEVASRTELPTIVMTYVNPLLRRGLKKTIRSIADAGASALIVPDLPVEELDPFLVATTEANLGMAAFVAPTTDPQRLAEVISLRPSFIYGVSDMGVTGTRDQSSGHAAELADRVRAAGDVPLVLGVGISNPEQAAEAAKLADGVIVGSALVSVVANGGRKDQLGKLAGEFAAAIHF